MTLKDRTEDVMKMLDEETTRSNKELLIAAAVCTLVGIIIGFLPVKYPQAETRSRNIINAIHMTSEMTKNRIPGSIG